jgi:hypothetical protein
MRLFGLDEGHDSIPRGMNCEISRHICAWTSNLGSTSLAHQNLTISDFLATKALDAKALASIVMDVFGGTASFYM